MRDQKPIIRRIFIPGLANPHCWYVDNGYSTWTFDTWAEALAFVRTRWGWR